MSHAVSSTRLVGGPLAGVIAGSVPIRRDVAQHSLTLKPGNIPPGSRTPARGGAQGAGATSRFSFQKGMTPGISHLFHISSTFAWK